MPWGSRRRRLCLWAGPGSCGGRPAGWGARAPGPTWPRGWRRISWRNRRAGRRWTVQCLALRVTPAHAWRERRLAPEVWLLAERDTGQTPQTKYYFVHRPATTSLLQLVRFAHQRWAIEQQYRELKTNLGLDHFEGRTFPGWHHHVVLTAITYNFLQGTVKLTSGAHDCGWMADSRHPY